MERIRLGVTTPQFNARPLFAYHKIRRSLSPQSLKVSIALKSFHFNHHYTLPSLLTLRYTLTGRNLKLHAQSQSTFQILLSLLT